MAKRSIKAPQETKPKPLRRQMQNRIERNRRPKRTSSSATEFLSTGSTMLNLAMSDSIRGGWPVRKISTLPGKSAAGKTVLVLSTFTEACLNPIFDKHQLIYDDVERRCDFNLAKLFPPLVSRLVTPSGTLYKDLAINPDDSGISRTIQDLRNNMLMLKKKGEPFVYIADSLDSFSTDEEQAKEMKRAIAAAKSKEEQKVVAGSYNAEKAKILGQILRMINDVIADTGSIFILTQQLRQKMGATKFESPWTTSGGEAPYFYSHVRPFMTRIGQHKDLGCKIGITSGIRMDKNSVTGKLRDVEFDIYYDLGIDDTGSMVNFLLDQKYWKSGSWIDAPDFDLRENGRAKLIAAIEDINGEGQLKRIVQKVWNEREEKLLLDRKSRY